MSNQEKAQTSDSLGTPLNDNPEVEPALEGPMYSLGELAEVSGIAYGTLTAYLRAYPGRVPSQQVGRGRCFPAAAIDVLQQIRKERHARIGRHWRKRSRPLVRWEEQSLILQRIVKKAVELNALIRELQFKIEQSRPEEGEG